MCSSVAYSLERTEPVTYKKRRNFVKESPIIAETTTARLYGLYLMRI